MDERTFKLIEEAIGAGSTVEAACHRAGVSRPTFYRWRKAALGAKGDLTGDVAGSSKSALLDSAEELMAEFGLNVSLREIARHARVNHALPMYHFGNREGLIEALVERRLEWFNDLRFSALKRAMVGDRPTVAQIVEAWMLPGLRAAMSKRAVELRYTRIIGHVAQNHDSRIQSIAHRAFEDLHARFIDAFSLALPGSDRETLYWRYTALTGLFLNFTQHPNRIERISGGAIVLDDPEEAMAHMRSFLVAMMEN
ncbi:Bacterial regulatory protein, tetR family [Tsuneonella dongtanensis]|uniref:Bacterial regulatory protein, tetR family n=1 Tax=Tsuneonella dongtanensis TaxID=692370 RepID=A0A1B2ABR0_9SPHN|nr:TetR/AcrR family transcriptional regulator [Tsuneonella dongtanensis]ANY19586.1 Bacterial regulatory protein, tetR family [Tsuneonella dongtanensis]